MTQAANLGALGTNAGTTGILPAAGGGTAGTAGVTGFKNRLINGAMAIWQRGTSGTSIATSAFGPDRWRNYGGNALTLTQSTSFGSPQSLLIQANGTNSAIGQRIESANIAGLAGQTVTISYQIRADNPGTHKLLLYYANAQDNWSAETNFVNTSISYTSNTVTTITYTTTLPSQAANGISVVLQWYNGGATINLTAFVWNIQIEAGSAATNYDFRSIGTELALCQRYYETSYSYGVVAGAYLAPGWASGVSSSSAPTQLNGASFKVSKRATPTIVLYNAVSGASGYVYRVSDGSSVAATANYIGTNAIGYIDVTSSANGYYYHYTATAEL